MIVHEFECNKHGRIEKGFKSSQRIPKFIKCPTCKCRAEFMWPLTAMQPDNMWFGQSTQFGYFTSKSQYERTLKEKNLVTVDKKELDKVRSNVYNTRQDNKRKQINRTNDFLAKELSSVEISPDGNTVKEKIKYARKRQ